MIAVVLLALALAEAADTVDSQQTLFRYRVVERNGEPTYGGKYDVVVTEDQASYERPRDHLIIDGKVGKAYIVDHALKENFVFDWPVDRFDYLNEEQAELSRKIAAFVAAEVVETSTAAELETIAGLECRDHFYHYRSPGSQLEELMTVCLTVEDIPAAELYWKVVDFECEIMPGREVRMKHFAEIGGFPLRWKSDIRMEKGRMTQTMVVESIEVGPLDEAVFSPHPDYKETLPDPEGRFLSRPRPYPGS